MCNSFFKPVWRASFLKIQKFREKEVGKWFYKWKTFFEEMNWEEKSSTIYHCTVFGWVIKSVLAFVLLQIWFKYFRLCTHNNCPNVLILICNKKNYALLFFYESKTRFGLQIKLLDLVQIFLNYNNQRHFITDFLFVNHVQKVLVWSKKFWANPE